MIGVISKEGQRGIVEEFFQLFKTPWEFYDKQKSYDVVIVTDDELYQAKAKLLIIYGPEEKAFDLKENISVRTHSDDIIIVSGGFEFPIYGDISSLGGSGKAFFHIKGTSVAAGLQINRLNQSILRIGYDLFQEILFLLSSGQPPENAKFPTLEYHITILRNCILNAGISFMEIPPTPAGYDFITCLTHDVDFVRIGNHKFDQTMWGFLYRALIGSVFRLINNRISLKNLLQNYKAIMTLPFVYLGMVRDFWLQFDRYMEIEKGLPSTFFLIPFKKKAGEKNSGRIAQRRAAKYDIAGIQDIAKNLVKQGHEVGVHGIDAWHNIDLGRKELNRIYQVTGQADIGIRMHWLLYDEKSPQCLDQAGFSYDSTIGYNEKVGYKTGTTQVYKPFGAKKLLELPMHIQDTALFNPKRTGLSEGQANDAINELLFKAITFGGVLTINWHHRSIAPERLWKDFYIALIEKLKSANVWFGTIGQVIRWFRARRNLIFDKVTFKGNKMYIKLKCEEATNLKPSLMLRIYKPRSEASRIANLPLSKHTYFAIPIKGKNEVVNIEIG